ncbi:MAG: hypothetical protein WAV72_02185, partial [Bradyrhizobium sp.]
MASFDFVQAARRELLQSSGPIIFGSARKRMHFFRGLSLNSHRVAPRLQSQARSQVIEDRVDRSEARTAFLPRAGLVAQPEAAVVAHALQAAVAAVLAPQAAAAVVAAAPAPQ